MLLSKRSLPFYRLVKRGIGHIEILWIEIFLRFSYGIAKALVVNYLTLTEELDGVSNVGIVHKAKNIVIGGSCLLLCYYHVFATTLSVALRRHLSQRARLLVRSAKFIIGSPSGRAVSVS